MARRLPPLNAVRAFEASARLGGFLAASRELGVSPAAVSLHVKKLEAFYGAALFRRLPSGVALTETGEAIFADCLAALATLAGTVERVEGRVTRARIVLSALPSLAHRWLGGALPRLAALRGDARLELRAEGDPVELDRGPVDLRVTYGTHLYPGRRVEPLMRDRLTPMCAPEWWAARGLGAPPDPAALDDAWLIHTWWAAEFAAYPAWDDWFAAAGAPRAPAAGLSPSVDHPSLALDLALGGLGIALGQHALAWNELATRRLIAPFAAEVAMPHPYAVITSEAARRKPGVLEATQWLREEAARLAT